MSRGLRLTAKKLIVIRLWVFALTLHYSAVGYAQNSPDPSLPQVDAPLQNHELEIAELSRTVERYRQTLADFNGVYDASTGEIFWSLANAYFELANFAAASSTYAEALLALRIRTGLYTQQQLDLLEQYTSSSTSEKNWVQVDNNLQLSTHIAGRIYDRNDNRYTATANRLASWKIRAYQDGIYRDRNDNSLQEAIRIYARLIDDLPQSDADYGSKLATYLSAKGIAHYYSALYTSTIALADFPASASETLIRQRCYQVIEIIDGQRVVTIVCEDEEIPNPQYFVSKQLEKNAVIQSQIASMRRSFRQAVEAIETKPDATVEEIAVAILNLGDMNFLAQEYDRANAQYARAYELLSADGVSAELRDKLLGEPKKVMQGILAVSPLDTAAAASIPTGIVSFDVSIRGDIRNISVSGRSVDLEDANTELVMAKLRQSTYRPKIADGLPTDSRLRISATDL